jgi:hypothetical protein
MALLGVLDLYAAFDCVEHEVLLHRLPHAVGLSWVEVDWIRSFLAVESL